MNWWPTEQASITWKIQLSDVNTRTDGKKLYRDWLNDSENDGAFIEGKIEIHVSDYRSELTLNPLSGYDVTKSTENYGRLKASCDVRSNSRMEY